MSFKLSRTIVLGLGILGLMAAAPAFAGQAPAQGPAIQAPALQAAAGCPPSATLFAAPESAPTCSAKPVAGVPERPAFMATTAPKYTGYCHCGCRFVKDCNTDADCGGGRCLGGVSCC
jgi:hypothetical protein